MAWILLGAAVVLLVLWVAYRMAFYSPVGEQNDPYRILPNGDYQARREEMLRLIAALEARPCERVSVTSHDGLRLTGRYYHHADGAPLDIAFHGYRGHALRDFCGGSCISFQLGHNLLLVDQRAHGESEGHTITFGAKESRDCLDWVNWANARFGSPDIALFGVSMGAATVLLATALDLPENVRCAVADSPYSRAEDIIGTVGRDMGLPGAPVILLARCAARVFGGFRLGDASPLDAVRRAKVPVLLFHGEADRLVPCAMSGVLQENCASAVRRYTYPNAGHGLSYLVDREGYTAAVVDFLAQCGERESS
ncbi:MAG: alpha/beta hydrolase [Ruminococcaceae bacterium]|nr:alpha/beta hydrolase [Oscillospiraceae bacterium]